MQTVYVSDSSYDLGEAIRNSRNSEGSQHSRETPSQTQLEGNIRFSKLPMYLKDNKTQ